MRKFKVKERIQKRIREFFTGIIGKSKFTRTESIGKRELVGKSEFNGTEVMKMKLKDEMNGKFNKEYGFAADLKVIPDLAEPTASMEGLAGLEQAERLSKAAQTMKGVANLEQAEQVLGVLLLEAEQMHYLLLDANGAAAETRSWSWRGYLPGPEAFAPLPENIPLLAAVNEPLLWRRLLHLPRLENQALEEAIQLELGGLLPSPVEKCAYAKKLLETQADKQIWEVAALPQTLVQAIKIGVSSRNCQLLQLTCPPDRAYVEEGPCAPQYWPLLTLAHSYRAGVALPNLRFYAPRAVEKWPKNLVIVLLGVIWSCFLLLGWQYYRTEQVRGELQAMAAVAAMDSRLQQQELAKSRLRQSQFLAKLLENLGRNLPQDCYLQEVRQQGNRVVLVGIAPNMNQAILWSKQLGEIYPGTYLLEAKEEDAGLSCKLELGGSYGWEG